MPTPATAQPAPQPAPAPASTPAAGAIPPERQERIERWAADNASVSRLQFWTQPGHARVADALGGRSDLGPLTRDEQTLLLDRSIATWTESHNDRAMLSLADDLRGNRDLSSLASGRFARAASDFTQANIGRDPTMTSRGVASENRGTASSLATAAVRAAPDDAALGQTLQDLGPSGAGALADGVAWGNVPGTVDTARHDLGRLLNAANALPEGDVSRNVTEHALATGLDWNYARTAYGPYGGATYMGPTEAAAPMGTALARLAHPGDPAAQARDADRFAGVLSTPQGAELLGGTLGNEQVTTVARFRAVQALADAPGVTGATLARQPWTDPALAGAVARGPAQIVLDQVGDAPVALDRAGVERAVRAALPGASDEVLQRAQANILPAGTEQAEVAILPVQVSTAERGPVQVSLFRVGTGNAERYVDNEGRSYGSFAEWQRDNRLPPGVMTVPVNGHLTGGDAGQVLLETRATPRTIDTPGERALAIADGVALAGGVAAGVAVTAGGGWVPLAGLAAAGLWTGGREAQHLADMAQHGQTLDPLSSAEARGAWLNMLASGAVVGGSVLRGGTLALGTDTKLAEAAALLSRPANAAAGGLSFLAGGNQALQDVQNWGQLSPQERMLAGLNMAFLAASSAGSVRSALESPRLPAQVPEATLQAFRAETMALRDQLPSRPRRSGNVAVAGIDVPGLPERMAGHSQIGEPRGEFVGNPAGDPFRTRVVPNTEGTPIDRSTDSEYKILGNIANQLGDNRAATGSIVLFTERATCDSCARVVSQFRWQYPGIQVTIVDNQGRTLQPPPRANP